MCNWRDRINNSRHFALFLYITFKGYGSRQDYTISSFSYCCEEQMTITYKQFLETKQITDKKSGFRIPLSELNSSLFDWQKIIVQWAIHRGRAALFEGCGLGKTLQQLEWAKQIHRKEKEPILILAPLAVAEQTCREGEKFGIAVNLCTDDSNVDSGINVTNYEKLHKFRVNKFVGVVLDESGILKNFTGATRNEVISAFQRTPYRLACTATPAPNDYMELGNHSEFLGVMSRTEMLATFFINDSKDTGIWRLKGHIQNNIFWEWLASWAIMISKPSDIGFNDGDFKLPPISYHEHILKSKAKPKNCLFLMPAKGLNERRKIRQETVELRTSEASRLINDTQDRWVCWCNLNAESEAMSKKVNDAVEVTGSQSDTLKIDRMTAFALGRIRRIVTKPKIAGLGMNWQICNKAAFIGLNDSWEQFYQAVRRIWRFGQKKEVEIHIFIEEREGSVLENIQRKDKQAKLMLENMIKSMKNLTKKELEQCERAYTDYSPQKEMRLPSWIR